ncbi:MAG: hypothetical protein KatS3mg110_4534 [Pirellulaceae bacterium]|nr:MAG: hypothetical protein KatS3mg110_4534 [Pirellulaceae bacterium]
MKLASRNRVASDEEPIGLIAGWGRLPVVAAEAIRQAGYRLYALGIQDHADPDIAQYCADFQWAGLGKLGRSIRYFRQHGVRFATMAGKIQKVLLLDRFCWWKHFPDWTCFRTFYPHWISRTRDRKDDTLLLAVVRAYAEAGITFLPVTDFAPELLVPAGLLAGPPLSSAHWKDIAFGWKMAKEMGRLDVGQSVVVKGLATIAIEAVEGTDQCIVRAGQLCPSGGFTVVKVAKPQQDMRFDVPTIGPQTLTTLATAGGRVLAIEAGKTIVLDMPDVCRLADQHRISLVAVTPDMLPPLPGETPSSDQTCR